jgi:hypothetical protein
LTTAYGVTHVLDYGYFTITGGIGDADELSLLGDAQDDPPSTGNGNRVLVLSPHQNNFAMDVVVEQWSGRPPTDVDEWEQVSVEALEVDASSTLWITSPTLDSTTGAMPEGRYWVEISGRGFINYGWPGSTEPGDQWRLRFWPNTGPDLHPRKLWLMPGFGTLWNRDR